MSFLFNLSPSRSGENEKLIDPSEEISAEEQVEKLRETIQMLMDICAENEIDVPEEVKEKVSGAAAVSSRSRSSETTHSGVLRSQVQKRSKFEAGASQLDGVKEKLDVLRGEVPELDLRVVDGSYTVTNRVETVPLLGKKKMDEKGTGRAKQEIKTVATTNPCYKILLLIKRCIMTGSIKTGSVDVNIMENANLALEAGKMYLVLGAPGSGKSTLLKYIANSLLLNKHCTAGGKVSIAGISPKKGVYWTNLVAYIDQIDRLHPFLTVRETLEFAFKCRTGGTHRRIQTPQSAEADQVVKEADEQGFVVNGVMNLMGIARVADTFVGDQQRVRGVSGGERKRVTVSEMFTLGVPVMCCDEISTGLDAATTFDITRLLGIFTRMTKTIKIVSLLQPPPETVANFDELILISDGKIIYSGPIEEVIEYFEELGYEIPERMDTADWLQALPTKEGWQYLAGAQDGELTKEQLMTKHLDTIGFHEKFYESKYGKAIIEKLNSPISGENDETLLQVVSRKFANSRWKSFKLLVHRELLLWWRDKYAIKAKLVQTAIMGILVGTLFFQSTGNPRNVVSIAFQSIFYVVVSAMVLVVSQFPARSVFYKQQDANFFPTWAYVVGRSIAALPVAFIDGICYGTLIYWLTGLAYNEGASVGNYFMFLLLTFSASLTSGFVFGIFSSAVRVVASAQACNAITAVILVIFSGFTVQPNVIPPYWIWMYWINFVAWSLRSLLVNEFQSGKYSGPSPVLPNATIGEQILIELGFSDANGDAYGYDWTWWGFLFSLGAALFCMIISIAFLNRIRYATGGSLVTDQGSDEIEEYDPSQDAKIPFTSVDLTFKDIHYFVNSSITKDTLELLKGIDGIVRAGKMTALMGSSGAGKTTLMDVLSLRKSSGEITGEVRLNGHLQEEKSFRRCTGYVEQFDVQSPQLTIRETVSFSAKLRLSENDPAVTPESREKFIEQTLSMLELTNIQDLQVGSDESGGLSFEQRKRLSIAVEVVANPSILFLDEPTSGLDARAAAIVMRGMRRIASSGRAVCATIHQPSVAIFNDFDTLLLLKRGGEVVFHGDLGKESSHLIEYLERFEATKKIQPGENPATWMLTVTGAGSAESKTKPFDYAGSYSVSKLREQCVAQIDQITAEAKEEGKIVYESSYAASRSTQNIEVLKRTMKIYFRSPSYNTSRMIVSGIVALLFASVYASDRVPKDEADMNSRVNSIFIAVLFLCVSALNTVLSFYETERNMFYRHKAAHMYRPLSIAIAFTIAEFPFILIASTVFNLLFYFILGFAMDAGKFFLFFLFVTLGLTLFSFLGQMLVASFRDAQTAQSMGALIVSSTSLFSGVFIRPNEIPNYWIWIYWTFPGHYLMEGLLMSQFVGDPTEISASFGSPFYLSLGCNQTVYDPDCSGSASKWIESNFTDFSRSNIPYDIIYLIGVIFLTRVINLVALYKLNYRAT